jgi:hypothetical protein
METEESKNPTVKYQVNQPIYDHVFDDKGMLRKEFLNMLAIPKGESIRDNDFEKGQMDIKTTSGPFMDLFAAMYKNESTDPAKVWVHQSNLKAIIYNFSLYYQRYFNAYNEKEDPKEKKAAFNILKDQVKSISNIIKERFANKSMTIKFEYYSAEIKSTLFKSIILYNLGDFYNYLTNTNEYKPVEPLTEGEIKDSIISGVERWGKEYQVTKIEKILNMGAELLKYYL